MPVSALSKFRIALLLTVSVAAAPLAAQQNEPPPLTASPSLTARIAGIDSPQTDDRKLAIERLDVRVRIHGAVAETTITARFHNESRDILEGDFRLAMPDGSVVTGYALDIGDTLVDGVLVDQRQGRIAYEARVRQRIDPGLAEVDRANQFRTRIFPINPGGSRTIRLRFTSPIDPRAGYALPIRDSGQIGTLTLDIEAAGFAAPPTIQLPNGFDPAWRTSAGIHRITADRRNARLEGDIVIAAPAPGRDLLISRHANGTRFFQISDEAQARGGETEAPRSVALLWDRSLSRADDDLEKEVALARAYLERVRPQSAELLLFDSGGVERVRVRDADELATRLRAVRYRGATSLAPLARERMVGVDACLLFTDGLVTIDRRDGFQPPCPIFAVSSGADADRAWLSALARRSGGEAFDLAARPVDEALNRITRRVPRVTAVRSTTGAAIDYRLLDGGENGWRIVGPMPASGDVVVRLSGVSGERERIYATGTAIEQQSDGAGALWAAERVAILAASDERDRDALVAFSRSHSVASPDVSFIVLETGRDYANARFEPPANLPAALIAEYRQVRDQMKEQETEARSGRLRTVLAQWEEMRGWWDRRFEARPRVRSDESDDSPPVPEESSPPPTVVMPSPPSPPPPPTPLPPTYMDNPDGSRMVVTGTRVPRPNVGGVSPVTAVGQESSGYGAADRDDNDLPGEGREPTRGAIALEPWAADRPYLAALEAAAPGERDRVFAEQQRTHGALPAFWLDVADRAFRQGRRAEAVQLVLSALELPTRNSQTLAIVAERLLRYGEIDRAIWLLERLAQAEDDRPQPRRTLALALARRAQGATNAAARPDLARAISLLTEVVMNPLDNAYEGIDMIALMEANRLIPRYRQLGGGELALDPRLIALMDVDLRVVIEWQSEATDVDLWVDEPTGERAIYHNPRTAIGGRLSNDMTQGFGPEEYLLRRAPDGTYQVRANVFASDRLNPNGGQRVTARIIRDWGRATEREEVVDLELLPTDQTRERRVGTITFGRER